MAFHINGKNISTKFQMEVAEDVNFDFICNDYFFSIYAINKTTKEIYSFDSNLIPIDAVTSRPFYSSSYNSLDRTLISFQSQKSLSLSSFFPVGYFLEAPQNIFSVRAISSSIDAEYTHDENPVVNSDEAKTKSYYFDHINETFTAIKLILRDDFYFSQNNDELTIVCDEKFNQIDTFPIDIIISATEKYLIGYDGFMSIRSKSFIQFPRAPWSKQSIIGDTLYQFRCDHYRKYFLDIYSIIDNSLILKSTDPIPLNNIVGFYYISPSVGIMVTKSKSIYTVQKIDIGPENSDWPSPICDYISNNKSDKGNHLKTQLLMSNQFANQMIFQSVQEFDACLESHGFYTGQTKAVLGNRKASLKNVPNESMTGSDYLDHMCILPVQIEHEAGNLDDYKAYFEQIFTSSPISKKVTNLTVVESERNYTLKLTVGKKAYEVSFPIPDDSDLVSNHFFEAIEGILVALFPEWTLCTFGSVGIVSRDALTKLLEMGAI